MILLRIRRPITVANDPPQDFEELAVKYHSSVCLSHIAKLKSETGSFSILLREFMEWGMIIHFPWSCEAINTYASAFLCVSGTHLLHSSLQCLHIFSRLAFM